MQLLAAPLHGTGPSADLSEASSLSARTVVDREGRVLGSVVDIMLDLERGCIAYAVVGAGGFVGIGERLFPVPWGAFRAVGDRLELQGERGEFDRAPSFDREHWPRCPAAAWHRQVHAHYRSRPYWE